MFNQVMDQRERKQMMTRHAVDNMYWNARCIKEKQRERALRKRAESYGIETKEKDIGDIVKEISIAQLKEEAKNLGINPKGKEVQQIMVEIKEKQIQLAAAAAGIETANKTLADILDELVDEHEQAAKYFHIFPAGERDVAPLKKRNVMQ
ncbi:hypothetical protein SAMN05192534_10281 [Alteribacillus persepolensis]|uniref:Uncharacterized protein n=1 Tax=Alteribacillus persepolensis TaxID=568899 RepID=A0A1G8AAC7_9BACI|nr:hypothetical protein SAMN05192534_10281 [Alteribacillus persepolensis]